MTQTVTFRKDGSQKSSVTSVAPSLSSSSTGSTTEATQTTPTQPSPPKKKRGLDRFQRTTAEKLLLRWILAWMVLAAIATCAMLVVVIKINSDPIVDQHMTEKLDMLNDLTRESYSSQDVVAKAIINSISRDSIQKILTAVSATKPADLPMFVKNHLDRNGVDYVYVATYNVLKSVPDPKRENKVRLYRNDDLLLTAATREVPAPETVMAEGPAYNAYAAAGNVTNSIVYVNYGRQSDYDYLKGNGVILDGMVFLARLGMIPKAKKLELAEMNGAAALVLFLDPATVGPRDPNQRPFPDSWWVGGSAIQRGSVSYVYGDPLTPGYPSRGGMPRIPVSSATLPSIPCQPIGYDDARTIMKELNESKCPDNWKPKLGVRCNVMGPSSLRLQVEVNNRLVSAVVANVIGVINGSIEPDRLVIVGNHMDSQSVFAADHSLGVSLVLEQARVLGQLHMMGAWEPRRSVVFTLWDGEEQAMLGSTEWVEDHLFRLQSRAVVYISTELLSGDRFRPRSSPAVSNSIRHASSLVPYYKKDSKTLFDAWTSDPAVHKSIDGRPLTLPPVGRTDDAPFIFSAGVPTAFIRFTHDYNGTELYPAYHTGYDTMQMLEKYLDPGLHVSIMSTQLATTMTRLWADRNILPYDLNELTYHLHMGFERFQKKYKKILDKHGLDIRAPRKAVEDFCDVAARFTNWTKKVDRRNPIVTRIINDNVMRVEKIFVRPGGSPTGRFTVRNLVYSPEGFLFPTLEQEVKRQPPSPSSFGLEAALLADVICQATDYLIVTPV